MIISCYTNGNNQYVFSYKHIQFSTRSVFFKIEFFTVGWSVLSEPKNDMFHTHIYIKYRRVCMRKAAVVGAVYFDGSEWDSHPRAIVACVWSICMSWCVYKFLWPGRRAAHTQTVIGLSPKILHLHGVCVLCNPIMRITAPPNDAPCLIYFSFLRVRINIFIEMCHKRNRLLHTQRLKIPAAGHTYTVSQSAFRQRSTCNFGFKICSDVDFIQFVFSFKIIYVIKSLRSKF